jgi:excinuclease UvrABC nuclease subunit
MRPPFSRTKGKRLSERAWTNLRSIRAAAAAAPDSPGVYAIKRTYTEAGLPLATEVVYVGTSKQLKQRIGRHHPLLESNSGLRKWLVEHAAEVEVAYTLVANDERHSLEQELIRRLQPMFNRIRNWR